MSRLNTGDFFCTVTFRCPYILKKALEKQAACLGVDMSTYIRALLKRALLFDLRGADYEHE